MPPVFLTPKRGPPTFTHIDMQAFRAAYYDTTETGWQNQDSFLNFVKRFIEEVKQIEDVQFPVVLFVDGQKSHISEECALLCNLNDVILYGLNGNSTHILQPLDVGIFNTLKKNWFSMVNQMMYEDELENYQVTVFQLPKIAKKVWQRLDDPELIQTAFNRCGLFPWDVDAIDFTKIPKKLRLPEDTELCCSETDDNLLAPTTADEGTTTGNESADNRTSNTLLMRRMNLNSSQSSPEFKPWALQIGQSEAEEFILQVPYEMRHNLEFLKKMTSNINVMMPDNIISKLWVRNLHKC